ncbi:MAG TPA: hypothetical protein VFH80_03695 [Solirubrobacteraceae bacterium]|nr:hypothetical protein [Solirubrobacteraceae bacterium]
MSVSPAVARVDVVAIQRWLDRARRSWTLAHRAQTVYTAIVVAAIFGVLVYGTASSALADVIGATSVGRWGPSLMLVAFVAAGMWGVVQGPVVFSPADLAVLLAAPLPRAELVARPLRRALLIGAGVGVIVAGIVLVGLTGHGRDVAVERALGVVVGVGLAGVICVTLAWVVSISASAERWLRLVRWPAVAVAGGLVLLAVLGGRTGRTVALWSGPWGWTVSAGAGGSDAGWIGRLVCAAVATVLLVAVVWARRGVGETERFARRAEGRAHLQASLMDFNVRTGRRDLADVSVPASVGAGGRVRSIRWLRGRLALVGARRLGGRGLDALAVVWRDVATVARFPARVAESLVLAAGGAVLVLLDVARPVAVVAGAVLIYVAGAWLLEPMRIELDVPSRPPVFLGVRPGRALLAHTVLPALVVFCSVAVCAVVLALTGQLVGSELPVALALVAAAPAVVGCAGMSPRRGGRLPQEVLISAVTTDPSGGGLVLLGWLLFWPAVATAIVYVPVRAITVRSPVAHSVVSVGIGLLALAVVASLQWRDPAP